MFVFIDIYGFVVFCWPFKDQIMSKILMSVFAAVGKSGCILTSVTHILNRYVNPLN